MKIDIRPLNEGQSLSFSHILSLSPVDFAGRVSFDHPVTIGGTVSRRGGLLTLSVHWRVWGTFRCDRCDNSFSRLLSQTAEYTLTDGDTGNREDMAPLIGDFVDIDEIVITDVILSVDNKNLCSEDCKGDAQWIIEEV